MKKRGFEIVTKYQKQNINLPYRTTTKAAGYDIQSAVDMVLPSIWHHNFIKVLWQLRQSKTVPTDDFTVAQKALKPYLVPTGVKAYMQDDEMLMIANRSSNPLKRGLWVPNGIGVVDADYYNNDSNEGELFVQLINFGLTDYHIHKGDRIAQGIFMSYLRADAVDEKARLRQGGFGSSGK